MIISKIYSNVCFNAGKVHVYSDFDGTYCPAKHSSLHNQSANPQMPEYCSKMQRFFSETKGDIDIHITTGRTFGEYEAIEWLLKIRGYELPLPDSFIAKNGSDEYIKIGSDEEFYKNGKFPFRYSDVNTEKEQIIQKQTKWDGVEIQNFIKKTAEKYHLPIVEADSENSVKDYGEKSLYSYGKLNADDWRKLPQKTDDKGNKVFLSHEKPMIDYKLGFRRDGNLKINLVFTPDYGPCKERNYIYDSFMNEIKTYLSDKGVDCHYSWESPSEQNHYRNTCSITPKIDNGELIKLYDTKRVITKAQKEKDLVVLAGDGLNDFEMLNPLEYLDSAFVEDCKKKSTNDYYNASTSRKLNLLKEVYNTSNTAPQIAELRTELQNNGYLKKIEELPMVSVIVDKPNSKLLSLYDTFAITGKVIKINNGELDIGIKNSVIKYAKQNKDFRIEMSKKLKTYLKNVSPKKNKSVGLIVAAITTFLGLCGVYMYQLTRKKHEN